MSEYKFKEETDLITFGIYEGEAIGHVMRVEPQYIDWCIKNFKGFKLYKKLNEKFEKIKNNDNTDDEQKSED